MAPQNIFFFTVLINFKQLIPVSKIKNKPNSNKITNQSVLAMENLFLKKICFEFILPWQWSQQIPLLMLEGCDCFNFWYHQKNLVQTDHPIFLFPVTYHADEHWMERSYGEEKIAGCYQLQDSGICQ